MPEGDTIRFAARRIAAVLEGHVPDEIVTPHPRFGRDRWPERLAGRRVRAVETHGKHMLLRFEGGLTIHSHLRMTGVWRVLRGIEETPAGSAYSAPSLSRSVWLMLRRGEHRVLQINGPVLELMTDVRSRFDQRLARLGPDVLAPEFDRERFLRRLREDDPTRPIGDALLDQRIVAGIGNMWKAEGCFAAGIDPWRPAGEVSDAEAVAVIDALRPGMLDSAFHGFQDRFRRIHRRAGRPCPRCGSRIAVRNQGDEGRATYWCPTCQR